MKVNLKPPSIPEDDKTPIKHMCRQNQRILGVRLANPLILLMPKFTDAAGAQKTWCGKSLPNFKKALDLCENYAN
jgi:hypothetical protein